LTRSMAPRDSPRRRLSPQGNPGRPLACSMAIALLLKRFYECVAGMGEKETPLQD
jgi:hypothetical protein